MKILVSNRQQFLPLSFLTVRALVKAVLKLENCLTDEVSIHFVTKKKIGILHDQFFGDPSPTDCISLPMDMVDSDSFEYRILGEIFVCPEIAYEYLNADSLSSNVYEEVSLYVVHGLLHLLGYDDIDPKDRKLMRKKEAVHMNALKQSNLLLK